MQEAVIARLYKKERGQVPAPGSTAACPKGYVTAEYITTIDFFNNNTPGDTTVTLHKDVLKKVSPGISYLQLDRLHVAVYPGEGTAGARVGWRHRSKEQETYVNP